MKMSQRCRDSKELPNRARIFDRMLRNAAAPPPLANDFFGKCNEFLLKSNIDLQTADVRIGDLALGPPLFQTVGHEIAGIARSAKEQIQLAGVHFQNTPGRQNGFGMHIVIRCRYRFLSAGYTAP